MCPASFCGQNRPGARGRTALHGTTVPSWPRRGAASSALAGAWRKNGVVEIAIEKRIVDWNVIKGEYISSTISKAALANKYGVTYYALNKRSKLEKWGELRARVQQESIRKVTERTADAAADNAVIAERIKTKLLDQLEKLADVVLTATEEREYDGPNLVAVNRLRDLTAALKDLTGDMPRGGTADVEDLSPLVELLGGKQ